MLTSKCISDTFFESAESVNTSGVHIVLSFNLKNATLYIFFFSFSYRNVNQKFFRPLNPLNKLAIPYFTYFILWRHNVYIVCSVLSWIVVSHKWFSAF